MKKITKISIRILIVLAVIFLLLNILVSFAGKAVITGQIEKNLKLRATIERLSFSYPLTIGIHNLDIKGLAKVDALFIKPSLLGFLAGKIVLSDLRVIRPQIIIEKGADGKLNLPVVESKGKQPPVLLAGLSVKEGKLIYLDRKITPGGFQVSVSDINADISKVSLPITSLLTNFNLSAILGLEPGNPSGTFAASGWIDFGPKNMEGKVELKDIDITYLAPYYRNFMSAKKIVSAKLNFTSDLKAQNNDLAAKCHLRFSDIVYKKEEPVAAQGEAAAPDLTSSVLGLLSDQAGDIIFNFTFKTKLDNPKIDPNILTGAFTQSAVENILSQPSEKIADTVKEIGGQLKDLGKSLKDIFKKEEKE